MSRYAQLIKSLCPVLGSLTLLWGCAQDGVLSAKNQAESQPAPLPAASGECPQPRKTPRAPEILLSQNNPVASSPEALSRGRELFQGKARPLACKLCHGEQGDGQGDPDFESTPPARNFTCTPTMNALPDGQLFWIVKNGSPNTSMPAYSDLSDGDIWRLVLYLRGLSKSQK